MMEELLHRIEILEQKLIALQDYSKIPLEIENALIARGFTRLPGTSGIVKANATAAPTTITPLGGASTVYVAATSGGAVTKAITFQDGIRTS